MEERIYSRLKDILTKVTEAKTIHFLIWPQQQGQIVMI